MTYDREVQRISKSVHSKLDLGQLSLSGAQSYNTRRPEIEIKPPKRDIMTSIIGLANQTKMARQKGTQNMIPQLDGTYNMNDSRDLELQEYLDLANEPNRPYNTRASKYKKKADRQT